MNETMDGSPVSDEQVASWAAEAEAGFDAQAPTVDEVAEIDGLGV